ncbi:nitrile hydratase subunit beta [Mesorhizobium sp. M00.F.Ca.ET.170.01.1.1]|nr:nitrile hydratase subunit beta [Mesorhizobium sp. M00.F.Ca.ET.170.01.1.1]
MSSRMRLRGANKRRSTFIRLVSLRRNCGRKRWTAGTGFLLIFGRAILNVPDPGWGPLRKRDDEPIFAEPWQAQAMAIANLMIGSGTISQIRWAEILGEEVRLANPAGSADDTSTYYAAVLASLERILDAGGHVSYQELARRRDEWRRAHLHTPHGQPVSLAAADLWELCAGRPWGDPKGHT